MGASLKKGGQFWEAEKEEKTFSSEQVKLPQKEKRNSVSTKNKAVGHQKTPQNQRQKGRRPALRNMEEARESKRGYGSV